MMSIATLIATSVKRSPRPATTPAHGIPVEVGDREPLEMLKDLHSQIAHHSLSEKTREPGLPIRGDELYKQREKEKSGAHNHDADVLRGHRDVDHTSR